MRKLHSVVSLSMNCFPRMTRFSYPWCQPACLLTMFSMTVFTIATKFVRSAPLTYGSNVSWWASPLYKNIHLFSSPPLSCQPMLQHLDAICVDRSTFGGHFFRSCSSSLFRRSFNPCTTLGLSLCWKIFPCNDVDLPSRKPQKVGFKLLISSHLSS